MSEIYNLMSDWELNDQLADSLLNRDLEQKFLYLWEWADLYYENKDADTIYIKNDINSKDLVKLWKKNEWKHKKICFISLGCGNSSMEKDLFLEIESKYNLDYIWVDSSKDMLDMSIKNLSKITNIKQSFICADIFTNEFRRELDQFTKDYDKRIFVFFSNTFGNKNHTKIIDILYNLLHKWEEIWVDVRLRKWTSAKDDMVACEYYHNWLKTKEQINLYFHPLKNLWIPFENWKMVLTTHKEKALNALKFQFSFVLNKKTNIKIRSDKITILPQERIELQQIYTYDKDWLINFFKEHNFKLKENIIKDWRGVFIFEKI